MFKILAFASQKLLHLHCKDQSVGAIIISFLRTYESRRYVYFMGEENAEFLTMPRQVVYLNTTVL